MNPTQLEVAAALLDVGAVALTPDKPITFKSGIVAPIYVDNRTLPYHPAAWRVAIAGLEKLVDAESLDFDVIAGIETGGIPHSAALAYRMGRPSVFVRKQPKEHGTKRRVEGGGVAGKRVLLIEDTITTGGSSLSGVAALRDEGANVVACLVIFSYGFPQAVDAFAEVGVPLTALTTLETVIAAAQRRGDMTADAIRIVQEWSERIVRPS